MSEGPSDYRIPEIEKHKILEISCSGYKNRLSLHILSNRCSLLWVKEGKDSVICQSNECNDRILFSIELVSDVHSLVVIVVSCCFLLVLVKSGKSSGK